MIGDAPALLLGPRADKLWLFVHGQGGSKEEARRFAALAVPAGWQVLGIDLPEHGGRADGKRFLPQEAVPELRAAFRYARQSRARVALRANSIGAWFGMLAGGSDCWERCLFVSPILDMALLIESMMRAAAVSEARLQREREIPTAFGQTLSWDYLQFARRHPIARWDCPTEILYAGGDAMTSRETVDAFAARFRCGLTVLSGEEHWFHSEKQLRFLGEWERRALGPA